MLNGTLDDFTLSDVLRLVAGARRTGTLAVARDEGAGDLHFRDGAVSRAVPRYERRAPSPSPNRAVQDLTFDLMRWGRGGFEWTPGTRTPAGPESSVDVEELLQEVSRRMEELAEIRALVPSEEAVLAMAPQPPEGAVQINITPAEWRVLVLVDGHRTVAEVAETAGLDDLEAMRLLYGLASAGLVSAGSAAVGAAIAPGAASDLTDLTDLTAVSAVSDTAPEEAYAPPAPEPEPKPEPVVAADPEPEPVAETRPEQDPFLADLDVEPISPFGEVPAAPAEAHEATAVDRSTAARELAGLFDDFDVPTGMERMTVAPSGPPPVPRRIEDDDQVTRGLISRLIDGVKGL